MVGICTHLGCTPSLRLDDDALNAELHAPGGFVCPCHGSRYDLAGRVVKNVPAPTNLEIPDYLFTGVSTLRIG
jgi:ubiquinol-cytochrome c reductase iron-sulfur subunit